MSDWERETFELINEGHFRITDVGPLHAPIYTFSIRGVESVGVKKSHNYEAHHGELREESIVRKIEALIRDDEKPAYTIDWLDNLSANPFVWPDSIKHVTDTTRTRTICYGNDGITLVSADQRESFSRSAVKFTVAGVDVCLCALGREESSGCLKPGCIIYVGAPDEEFRKKVRIALSFALGVYLVDLGSTVYCKNWEILSFKSKCAYSIDKKVFDLPNLPPAPLGMKFQNEIDRTQLARIVNSIIVKYDELSFGDLSWAYWHARCATVHIAAVHFGAAIEALQRRYILANPTKIATKIIPDGTVWSKFSDEIEHTISGLNLPNENKVALRRNVGKLNQVRQRAITESLLRQLNIKLGADEEQVWKRRNDAAHGLEMESGGELSLIRDTKLLKVIFHRMLLRITNGSDRYIDYSSIGFPLRELHEAVPSG